MDLLAGKTAENPDLGIDRLILRGQAGDSIAFAAAKSKIYYDARHKPVMYKPGQEVWLRLHQGYNLPGKPNRKLSQ
jgi:hypothetical protein